MNIDETLQFIHGTDWHWCKPGLERVSTLCRALGNPQDSLRFIHVAGTNGKGSTSAMLDSILRKAGYRVGLYTSPYIYAFNERIRYDGLPIPDADLCRIVEKIRPIVEGMADRPTEFELITAVALVYYAEIKPDFVVFEVGLGGRLDATNVIETSVLSLITGISLEHTAILGDTVEKIAAEKAGICKAGVPVAVGAVGPSVAAVIANEAQKHGTEAVFTAAERLSLLHAGKDGILFDFGEWKNMKIPFAALYQLKNAALVLTAVAELRKAGVSLPDEAVRAGLAEVVWAGRFEYFSRDPDVIYDGSHNPEGIAATAETLRRLYPDRKVCLLSGVMADKDFSAMIASLSPLVARVYAVRPDNPRSLPASDLAAAWQTAGIPAVAFANVTDAMRTARRDAVKDGSPLCILGSLYLYHDVLDAFYATNG